MNKFTNKHKRVNNINAHLLSYRIIVIEQKSSWSTILFDKIRIAFIFKFKTKKNHR